MINKNVLIIEKNKFIRDSAVANLEAMFIKVKAVESGAEAIQILENQRYHILVAHFEESFNDVLLKTCLDKYPDAKILLLISAGLDHFLDKLVLFPEVKNIIALRPTLSKKELLTTLLLAVKGNTFGIGKFMNHSSGRLKLSISDSKEKEALLSKATKFLEKAKISSRVESAIAHILDELIMNVIYDAPVDIEGNGYFRHLPRSEQVILHPYQKGTLKVYYNEDYIGLSASDPFGRLKLETVVRYLKECYETKGRVSEDSGGAGLGLYQIYRHSSFFILNVIPNVSTELIVLIDISLKDRLRNKYPKSFHYFEKQADTHPLSIEMLLKYTELSKVYEKRTVSDDYAEIVVEQKDLNNWLEAFNQFFGEPKKAENANPSNEDIAISEPLGGIRDNQLLYLKSNQNEKLLAMVWPWENGEYSTLKIGLQQSA